MHSSLCYITLLKTKMHVIFKNHKVFNRISVVFGIMK